MKRSRGYWWAPDGAQLAVARADSSAVPRWYVGDPAEPGEAPALIARPVPGRPNADVTLWIVGLDGRRLEVVWDRAAFQYLVNCSWTSGGLVIAVQSRDQRTVEMREVDPLSGRSSLRRTLTDPCWVTTFAGLPTLLADGSLVWAGVDQDTHTLFVDDVAITPPGLQLLDVVSASRGVVFTATSDSTDTHLFSFQPDAGLEKLSGEPATNTGVADGSISVITHAAVSGPPSTAVRRDGVVVAGIDSQAAEPPIGLRITSHSVGPHEIRTALLLPEWWATCDGPLPVLLDPYGGLAERKAMNARSSALLVSQWFANHGFAVVVADGRGTPGRGPVWERAVHRDIETLPVADQVAALLGLAEEFPDKLDTRRVGIRGWSWGGYLAAVCVLRRPDVFHAGVVGAAVTDHLLYQSYWKERQLGDPHSDGDRYERFSLVANAASFQRPLLLVHGAYDDNVFAAHTLRLAAALTAAGKHHELLVVPGVGHDALLAPTSREILPYQLGFLQRSLGLPVGAPASASTGVKA
jgi:dipeptidyl-peptidase-4